MKLFTQQPLLQYASWRSRLVQTGVVFSVSIFVSGASGVQWGWTYVQEQLAPRISRELSQSFNRPIQIGDVESVSLNSIRFGQSSMPATATDQDTLTIEAIEVQFSPVEFVRHQRLNINITLHNPSIWVDEQSNGWLEIDILSSENDDIEIQEIQVKNASVRLAPQPQVPDTAGDTGSLPSELYFEAVNGHVTFYEATQQITFEVEGTTAESGHFAISGSSSPEDELVSLDVHSDGVAIAPFAPILPPDITVQAGTVSSNFNIHFGPNSEWRGDGTLECRGVDARVAGEPNPFRDLSVNLELRDRQLYLEQGELLFGGIPFQTIEGTVDLEQGLNLTSEVEFVSADAFMETFQLDLPFPVSGALASQKVSISGPFDRVMFAGRVYNAEPVVLDHIPFPKAQTDFTFDQANDHLILSNLQFFPEMGGQLSLDADIHLGDEDEGETDTFVVDAQLADVSVDRLLQTYDAAIPNLQLGQIYADAHLEIFDDQPKLKMEWSLEQGQYPVQGVAVTDGDALRLVDTHVQVAGGQIDVQGAIANGTWHTQLQGSGIALQSFGVALPGQIEGEVRLGGPLADFNLATLQGDGQAQLQLEQGQIDATLALADGRWEAALHPKQIPLSVLDSDWPGQVDGVVKVAGAIDQLSPGAIAAEGELELVDALTIDGEPLRASLRWPGYSSGESTGQLEIDAAHSDLDIGGSIAIAFSEGWTPTPGEIDLDISAQDLNLDEVHIVPLAELDLHGLLTADGNVQGTLEHPEFVADLDLQALSIQHFAFDSQLQGKVRYTPDQINVDLRGDRDQIQVQSTPAKKSTQFALKRDRTTVEGTILEDGRLNATITALPLSALNDWVNRALLPSLQGDLSASIVAELEGNSPRAQVAFEVHQPAFGAFNPAQHPDHANDRLVGNLLYANNTVQLLDGQLHLGSSTFALNGQADLSTSLAGMLHVAIAQGHLQDLTTIFPGPSPETFEATPLSALDLPPLHAAQGEFSGDIWLARSPQGDLSAQVNFTGQDWHWGSYSLQTVQVPPTRIEMQQITLPIYLSGLTYAGSTSSIDTQITVSGQWNETAPLGQVQLNPIPLSFVASLFNLPITVNGEVGAVATLSGFPAQPEVVGEVELLNAQVHDVTIPHAKIGFSYGASGLMLENWESLQTATTARE